MKDLDYAELLADSMWTARHNGERERRRKTIARIAFWAAVIVITAAMLLLLPMPTP